MTFCRGQSLFAKQRLALRSCVAVIPAARACALACTKPTCLTYARTVSQVISEFANTGLAVATKKSTSRAVFIRVAVCVAHGEVQPRVCASLNAASGTLVPDNPGHRKSFRVFKNPVARARASAKPRRTGAGELCFVGLLRRKSPV